MQNNEKNGQQTTKYEVLSYHDREKIFSAALQILDTTGVKVYGEKPIELFKQVGAKVQNDIVCIPLKIIEKALSSAPKEITIYSRDGGDAILLNTKNSYFGNGSDCVYILDSFSGERRPFKIEDVKNAAVLLSALENIDFVMPAGIIAGLSEQVAGLYAFYITTKYTVKPVLFTALNRQGAWDIIHTATMLAGGEDALKKKPFIMHYVETSSPLQFSKDAGEMLIQSAEMGVPVVCSPGPIAGATAPATLAGILALHLAESLCELVLAQITKGGAPCIIGGCASIMDMKSTISAYAGPEFCMLNAALTELCHYLGLPMFGTAGCSDSKTGDSQAAIDSATSLITQVLCGADLIHDVGYIDSGLTQSFDMMVMSNEIIGMAKRMIDGIHVDDDHLALDIINTVGHGGNYLAEPHTVKYYRNEYWLPELINREWHERWVGSGSRDLEKIVNERVISILEKHEGDELEKEKDKEVLGFIKEKEASD